MVGRKPTAESAAGQYRALLESTPGAILVVDDDHVVFANTRALSLFGAASLEQLAAAPCIRFLTANDSKQAGSRVDLTASGQEPQPSACTVRTCDGRGIVVEASSTKVDFAGRPAVLFFVRDVTEERHARDQLEQQVRELRTLHGLTELINRSDSLDAIYPEALAALRSATGADRGAVLLLDGQGVMRFVTWHDLSERYRAAVEGHSPWAANEEHAQPVLAAALEREPSLAKLLPILRVEGIASLAFIPVSHQGRLLGKVMLYFNSPRELSEHEIRLALTIGEQLGVAISRQAVVIEVQDVNSELEERVRRRTAQLESANREMEAFCYSVSHDLRSPLRALDGFSRILLEDAATVLDDNDKSNLHRIIAASERMGKLMDDLLKLSRIGRAGVRLTTVDLSKLADEVMGKLRAESPERDLELRIAPDLSVDGDAGLLRTVLENLLGNAWKYTRHTPRACIELGVQREGDGARRAAFFVRDNGTGFDMRYAAKLFSPFQRVHSPTEFEGNGIGLAIVWRIMQRHGGRIWVESEPGRGATFWLAFWEEGVPADLLPARKLAGN